MHYSLSINAFIFPGIYQCKVTESLLKNCTNEVIEIILLVSINGECTKSAYVPYCLLVVSSIIQKMTDIKCIYESTFSNDKRNILFLKVFIWWPSEYSEELWLI